jgi:Spy/CpxP family protein refolding chaperone
MNPSFSLPRQERRVWLGQAVRASMSISLAGVGLKAAAQASNPGPAAGGGPRGPGGPGGERGPLLDRMLDRLLDGLDLSAEQRSRLQALAQRGRQEMEADRAPRQALRQQSLAEWAKPQLDLAAIEGLRAQMTRLHDEGSKKMNALLAEAAQVLSPPQRAQVVQRLQQMPMGGGPGMGGRHGGHGGPGGPGSASPR